MTLSLSRRDVLTVGALSAASASSRAEQSNTAKRACTFVLVHGGWHGGWCWRRVADRLHRQGQVVFIPTLTGLGERSHLLSPAVGLDTHITDIVNVLRWESLKDVVLVGHSYAGFVISGVAEQCADAIGSMVFLDAFVPANGEALTDLASQGVRELIDAARKRGTIDVPPVPASRFNLTEADRAWVDAKCTPHPLRTFTDRLTTTGAHERIARKAYIRATGFSSVPFDAAYATARKNSSWRTYEIAAGHDAMVDAAEPLAEILLANCP